MGIRVGINGFGRIGRNFFRAQHVARRRRRDRGAQRPRRREDDGAPAQVRLESRAVPGGGRAGRRDHPRRRGRVRILSERDPARCPGATSASTSSSSRRGSSPIATARRSTSSRREEGRHLGSRDRPGRHDRPRRQRRRLRPGAHQIVSNASCTTNCVAPLAKVLHEPGGIETGFMTTIHAYTNDQEILDFAAQGPAPGPGRGDQPHPDLDRRRQGDRARHAGSPGQGRRRSASARPVPDGSITDLVVQPRRARSTADEVNEAFAGRGGDGPLDGILRYSDDPIVSTDIIGSPVLAASSTAS